MEEIEDLPSLALSEKHQLPNCGAIYFAVAQSQVLYIGMATNLKQRWQNHHRCFQLETISKKEAVRLHWLDCAQAQLASLERQYIAHYSPTLNRSKVPTQRFTPSPLVLSTVLQKLRGRLLCIGIDSDSNPKLKTLLVAYLGAYSETRGATTVVRRVLQASNKRKDSLISWVETVRRKEGAHWRARCEGVEIQLIPYFKERLTHSPSLYEVLLDERLSVSGSVPMPEYKAIKERVRNMPFEERLSLVRSSTAYAKHFPLECRAQFYSIAGVDILCLTEPQLQVFLSKAPGLYGRFPNVETISADPFSGSSLV